MVSNRVVLDVAAFLDSPRARALTVEPAAVQKIAERFLEACYDDLGKAPRLMDGQDLHRVVGHMMPGRFARKDPLAESVAAVLEAYLGHLEETAVVSRAYEVRQSLYETVPEFLEAVRKGATAHHGLPQKPVVNRAEKTGRNDPCFCGSGLKFKKCHGKGG